MPRQHQPVPRQLGSIRLRYHHPLGHRQLSSLKPRRRGSASQDHERDRDERLQRLEAVLFLSREPQTSRKLSEYANLADATEARTLVRWLNESYDQGGRSFRVEQVAGGFQLLTRPQFSPWLRRLQHVPKEARLSAPALETLAVVAYRQPVGRADVEAIRGVACGEILRQLMDRDLVRIQGRSEELGRPYLYATTKRFLQLFGLRSLDKLPRVAEIQASIECESSRPAPPGNQNEEEPDVSVTLFTEPSHEDLIEEASAQVAATESINTQLDDDDDDDDDDEDDDFDEDDDEDDFDEDDEDEFDDDDDDDDDEFDDDEIDDEWEEVDDDDEDDDDESWDDDDDDDDWGDDDDDDEGEDDWD